MPRVAYLWCNTLMLKLTMLKLTAAVLVCLISAQTVYAGGGTPLRYHYLLSSNYL